MNIFVFKNVIDKPTRVTENSSTFLDPIILSDSLKSTYVINIPRNISDCDAAVAYIDCPKGIMILIGMIRWEILMLSMICVMNLLKRF